MKVDYKKIIVAHPAQQHSFRVAEALYKRGMLYGYVTTVYDKKSSLVMRITKHFLSKENLKRANKRKMATVPDSKVIQFCEARGVCLLLLQRIDHSRKIMYKFKWYVAKKFQKKLAKYIIDNHIGVVISYDQYSSFLFDLLKEEAPDVIRIIDNAHPNRNYLNKVYNEKIESAGEFAKTYETEGEGFLVNEEVARKFGEESKKADFHIVASQFSKMSVMYNGFDESRIVVAPYGVNNTSFKPWEKDYEHGLKVLFVGEINQRKGIAQILEAAKKLHDKNIEFNLVGLGRDYCSELYAPYEKYVNFRGRVSFEDLQMYYGTSHIFVFPSMGEGFGLVLLEALAAGLPLITSKNCGGPDIIEEGYNGFTIDAGSTEQLIEKIMWFYNNMGELPKMQQNAIQSIEHRRWDDYEEALISQLKEKIEMGVKEKGGL